MNEVTKLDIAKKINDMFGTLIVSVVTECGNEDVIAKRRLEDSKGQVSEMINGNIGLIEEKVSAKIVADVDTEIKAVLDSLQNNFENELEKSIARVRGEATVKTTIPLQKVNEKTEAEIEGERLRAEEKERIRVIRENKARIEREEALKYVVVRGSDGRLQTINGFRVNEGDAQGEHLGMLSMTSIAERMGIKKGQYMAEVPKVEIAKPTIQQEVVENSNQTIEMIHGVAVVKEGDEVISIDGRKLNSQEKMTLQFKMMTLEKVVENAIKATKYEPIIDTGEGMDE